jgi:hypothetical protein
MTAKDLADFLVRANATTEKAWLLDSVVGSFRRPLFKRHDILVFTRVNGGSDEELLLQVIEKGVKDPAGRPLNVFGEPKLLLKFANPGTTDTSFTLADGFMADAYGRTMAFGKSGDRVVYEGQYLGAPHGTPDEGGEGDPTTTD